MGVAEGATGATWSHQKFLLMRHVSPIFYLKKKKEKKVHKMEKSGNGFGISYIRITVSKDCSNCCACRLQFWQSSTSLFT